ncbi:MAG: MoaD/ThiS family protein [Hyphomonadaceae bacterium]
MPVITTISRQVHDLAGDEPLIVSAGTVRKALHELEARCPGLGAFIEDNMAIAIDGEIHQDALDAVISDDSEVVLIPKISGG